MVPVASVTCGVGPLITELPVCCEILISLPGEGLLFASCRVMVMVAVDTPSLVTLGGAAWICDEVAGGVTKVIVGVIVGVNSSPLSLAVKVTCSGVRSVTVKVAAPLDAEVTPLAGITFAWLPGLATRVTVWPPTVFPPLSRSFTTTKPCVAPSAAITDCELGKPLGRHVTTSEVIGLGAPTVCSVSERYNAFRLGEPKPTWAKSLPKELAL